MMAMDVRAVGRGLARLGWVAVRSFALTLAILTVLGFGLAGLAYYVLRDAPLYGAIAALVAVVEAVTAGVVLGGKGAMVMALAEGLRVLGLGRLTVRLVFERMLGLDHGQHGERGGALTRSLERLPIRQAEHALREAVNGLVAAPGEGGWLRRKLRQQLLRLVEKYTLARFREEDARHGGIDLVRVQAELEGRVDQLLVAKVRGGLALWTAAVAIGLPLAVAVQTYLFIALLHSSG
jgi:hypothetical protein